MKKQFTMCKQLNKSRNGINKIELKELNPYLNNLINSDEIKQYMEIDDHCTYNEYNFTDDPDFEKFKLLFKAINGVKPTHYIMYITNTLSKIQTMNIDFGNNDNRSNFNVIQRYYFALNGSATIHCNNDEWNINDRNYLQFPYLLTTSNLFLMVPYVTLKQGVRYKLQKNTQILCLTALISISMNLVNNILPKQLTSDTIDNRINKFNEENEEYAKNLEEKEIVHDTAEQKRLKIVNKIKEKQMSLTSKLNKNMTIEERKEIIRNHLKISEID